MTNPVVDLVGDQTGRLVPVYPQSGKAKIGSAEIAGYVDRGAGAHRAPGRGAARALLDELGLIGRTEAFRAIHAPRPSRSASSPRRRLAFDELSGSSSSSS